MTLLVVGLSLAETIILKMGSKQGKELKLNVNSFNFEDMDTKINYAKARFLFSLVAWAIYLSSGVIWYLITGKSTAQENNND